MADTKAAKEVAALDEFFAMLATDSSRAFYGPGHVVAAAEQGAVSKLLISDALYKCARACCSADSAAVVLVARSPAVRFCASSQRGGPRVQ